MKPESYFWHSSQWEYLADRASVGKLPHAILIRGLKGLGKTLFARRFANWLLCGEAERPCGECNACRQFMVGNHPDYFEVTFLEDKKEILVEQLRDLTASLGQTASKGGWKVSVIFPADKMNISAANSLLKTLEEPGADNLLILVTSNPARLPATIRSRCQQLTISSPSLEQAATWLDHPDPVEARIVLAHCGAAPIEAKRLLETNFLEIRQNFIQQMIQIGKGELNPVAAADTWRENPREALKWLLGWTRDIARLKQVPEETSLIINQDCMKDLQTAAERIHLISLHKYLMALAEGNKLLNTTLNTQLLLESLLIPWAFDLDPSTVEQLA